MEGIIEEEGEEEKEEKKEGDGSGAVEKEGLSPKQQQQQEKTAFVGNKENLKKSDNEAPTVSSIKRSYINNNSNVKQSSPPVISNKLPRDNNTPANKDANAQHSEVIIDDNVSELSQEHSLESSKLRNKNNKTILLPFTRNNNNNNVNNSIDISENVKKLESGGGTSVNNSDSIHGSSIGNTHQEEHEAILHRLKARPLHLSKVMLP